MPVPNVDELLRCLADAFERAGRHAFLVGGSVRDAMLHRMHKDVDLTTDATPDETRAILETTRPLAVYDVGARFGTIAAVFAVGDARIPVEITTFRAEAYEQGSRKPKVAYGVSLLDDLARRDFTINAMAQELRTGQLLDPYGGRADLEARLVRAVGDAEERFAEDPLRMLRAVRFAVELGFRLDEPTGAAIARSADALRTISRERVGEETNRILMSPEPGKGLRLLAELGLMRWIVPELLALREISEGRRAKDVFEHTLRVVEHTPPDLTLRWAALLHDVGKPRTMVVEDGEVHFPGHERVGEAMARQVLGSLRVDSETTERVARLVGMHMRANQYEPTWTDGAVRRLMREAGDELPLLLQLSSADVTSYRPQKVAAARARVEALRARIDKIAAEEEVAALKSPLDGNELMAMFGRPPGPWIREVKDYLLGLVLDGELRTDDKERGAELARAFMASR
ncbi:MAG TPA: HD domain-containing protein [Chloroflexota bacterium]|nr:HD domain-containing protein [Chloroflexota bacterium]